VSFTAISTAGGNAGMFETGERSAGTINGNVGTDPRDDSIGRFADDYLTKWGETQPREWRPDELDAL
jgi:hypothetical protein